MSKAKGIRIGVVGLGTVGQGVWKHLQSRKEELEMHMGTSFSLTRAAVRDLDKKRNVRIPASKLTDDPLSVATDPDVDLLCELMGGTEMALQVTKAALSEGKTVVTANKALLCQHGEPSREVCGSGCRNVDNVLRVYGCYQRISDSDPLIWLVRFI